ncbi:methyltransferase domain-containing protein [Brevibacillus sp. B_LB10_24]|uniref:methyltransferase domain-containing protein n=1 Tax=Brevibacillus sp. B_LB10_24 TaxID=3380645 RepID=UPI0038B78D86
MAYSKCSFCHFMYDEWFGDTRNGVPAGTPLAELAGSVCTRCGMQGRRHERQGTPLYAGLEAEYYDQFAGKGGIAFYRNWLLACTESPAVLELGVGTGRIAVEIAEKAGTVCGVDWSPAMLKVANAKRERIFKQNPERLELVEADVMAFQPGAMFSHVLCTDGLFQHYSLVEEQIALLQRIRENLRPGGWLAVDLLLPPEGGAWTERRCKRLPNGKMVYKQVEGETSLRRQLFHCTITFEAFVDGLQQARYRVEREYALMTPRELGHLLAAEGFAVVGMYENYGLSKPWRTASLPQTEPAFARLEPEETLADRSEAGEADGLLSYRQDMWLEGGYPLDGMMSRPPVQAGSKFTLISKSR